MRRYAPPVPRAGAGVRNAVIAGKKYRRILGDIRRVADYIGGRPTRMQYNRLRSAAGLSSSSLLQHGLAWSTVVAEAMALDPAEAAAIQQESDEAFASPPKRERPGSARRRLALLAVAFGQPAEAEWQVVRKERAGRLGLRTVEVAELYWRE